MPRCSSLPLCVHSLSPLRHSHFVPIISSCAYTITYTAAPLLPCAFSLPTPPLLFFREPSLSFPSHSLIPCTIPLIPLSLPSQTLILCAFTLIPLSFYHSVCLHSHSPLILSFRVPSLSFPSHSLIPCAFTRIPLYSSSHVRVLSSPFGSLLTCAISLVTLYSAPPSLLSLVPPSIPRLAPIPLRPPSLPSVSLLVCTLSLLPVCFSYHVRLHSHPHLLIFSSSPSPSLLSVSLLQCTFSLPYARPRYAPLPPTPFILCFHLSSLISPFPALLSLSPLVSPFSCPRKPFFPGLPLPPPFKSCLLRFPPSPLLPKFWQMSFLCPRCRLCAFDTRSVDSALPFEQDDDASSNAAVFGADDDGGEGAQAGVALAEEEDAPQFNLKDALAHWILSNRLSISEINALLEIMRKTILEIQDWKSYRDVQAYAKSRATDGHRGWRRKTIRSRNKAWLEYWYCDPLIALQDLLKNPKLAAKMVFHADPQYVGNVRVYSTPKTGLWWERLQTLVREEDPDGVVAALILASDETHMDHRGKAKGHPVYLTLGNIDKDDRWQPFGHVLLALLPEFPAEYNVVDKMRVHNYIMREVLQSLKTASYTGIAMKNATGETINVWPYLYAYVSDYPESCKITCTKSLGYFVSVFDL
ncbi:unnamed protein product [Closterium sp. NIES-65]|nr:unnamed protein product [Closterium sp. NIES-65]